MDRPPTAKHPDPDSIVANRLSTTRRLRAGLLVVPVIGLGLAARFLGAGLVADLSGGVLYAVLIYVLLVFVRPRAGYLSNAAIALAFCIAVELLQITTIPADLAAAFPPIRLVLGSTFAPLDLLAYVIGTALATGADALFGSIRSRRTSNDPNHEAHTG